MKRFLIQLLFCFLLFSLAANAQTELPPVYSTDGEVRAMAAHGDTLIVGGNFGHVGKFTGGGAMFSATSDQPMLNFPKIIGAVYASTPDGTGGYYIYGEFKKESETSGGYMRIEHILSDWSFEAGFSLQIGALFGFKTLLFHQGVLYIGGDYVDNVAGQPAGNLSAIDVATQKLLSWVPATKLKASSQEGGVTGLYVKNNTLYVLGGFDSVGGIARKSAAAIEIGTGYVKPWNPTPNWTGGGSYSDLVFYKDKIILGGNFGENGAPNGLKHACAYVDTISGQSFQYIFQSGGLFGNGVSFLYWAAGVSSLAIKGDLLYAFSGGTFDTRVTAVNLADSNRTVWVKYFNTTAAGLDVEVVGNSLIVTGNSFTEIYFTDSADTKPSNIERAIRNAVKLNAGNGQLENWFPDPVGSIFNEVSTLTVSGNNVFMGGRFSHVNGADRPGIVMIKASSQEILPFSISTANSEANAFKVIGNTLYAAGSFNYINGVEGARSVLAFNIATGDLLPWSPVNLGTASAIEADENFVYLGGSLTEPAGGAGRKYLFAINRQTGALTDWAPNPDGRITSLHLSNGQLYLGGGFQNLAGASRRFLASFDASSLGLMDWKPDVNGTVYCISTSNETVWAGGSFFRAGDISTYINGFVGINPYSGAVIHKIDGSGTSVSTLSTKGCYVLIGGFSYESCKGLSIYDTYSKGMVPTSSFCHQIDNNVNSSVIIGNDLYIGGKFTKVDGKSIAPYIGRIRFDSGYFNGCTEYVTVKDGDWHVSSTWLGSSVPPDNAKVRVRHKVTVSTSTNCFSLKMEGGGSLRIQSGSAFKVIN